MDRRSNGNRSGVPVTAHAMNAFDGVRVDLVALAITLALFFNLELFARQIPAFANPALHLLTPVAVALMLALPHVSRRVMMTLIAIVVGGSVGWMGWVVEPLSWTGAQTLSVLIPASFAAAAMTFAHRASERFSELKEHAQALFLSEAGAPPDALDEANSNSLGDLVQVSRRHDRPLSLVLVKTDPDALKVDLSDCLQSICRSVASGIASRKLGGVINTVVRRTDVVLIRPGSHDFILVCPETSAVGARQLVQHVSAAISSELGTRVACTVSCLSRDLPTFEEMLRDASSRLASSEDPVPAALQPPRRAP